MKCWSTSGLETSCHPAWHRLIKLLDDILLYFGPNFLQLRNEIFNIPGWLQSPSHNVPNVIYGREIEWAGWPRKYRASLKTIHSNTCRRTCHRIIALKSTLLPSSSKIRINGIQYTAIFLNIASKSLYFDV